MDDKKSISNDNPLEVENDKKEFLNTSQENVMKQDRNYTYRTLDEQINVIDNKILSEEAKIKSIKKNIARLKEKRVKMIDRREKNKLSKISELVKANNLEYDTIINNIDLFIDINMEKKQHED